MATKRTRTRTRITRIDVASPEALALHAASVADVRAKRGPTTRAKPWYLLAGIPTPSHLEQWVVPVYSTLTRLDYFNPKASGKKLKAAPVHCQGGACPGLEALHVEA